MTRDGAAPYRQPMPDDDAAALAELGLRDVYDERPAYQRNPDG